MNYQSRLQARLRNSSHCPVSALSHEVDRESCDIHVHILHSPMYLASPFLEIEFIIIIQDNKITVMAEEVRSNLRFEILPQYWRFRHSASCSLDVGLLPIPSLVF